MTIQSELQNARYALEQKRKRLEEARELRRIAESHVHSLETSVRLAEQTVEGLELELRGPISVARDSGCD